MYWNLTTCCLTTYIHDLQLARCTNTCTGCCQYHTVMAYETAMLGVMYAEIIYVSILYSLHGVAWLLHFQFRASTNYTLYLLTFQGLTSIHLPK